MSRIGISAAAVVAAIFVVAAIGLRLDRALRIALGATAHTLCSWTYLDGRDPDATFRQDIASEPGLRLIAPLIRYDVNQAAKEARASFAGLFERRASFTEGRGCRLALRPETRLSPLAPPASSLPPLDVDPARREAVEAALGRAFDAPAGGPARGTRAIVVLHEGRLVGERYARGWGPTSAFWGHSLSKSVTHALLGVLAEAGRFDPDAPAEIPEWREPGDPRGAITARRLMTMTAGFPPDETRGGWDRATRMWFDEADGAAFAASERPTAKPGARWAYHNGGVALLSRMVRDRSGGDAQAFARSALFGPAGMTSAVVEIDGAGTPVGSTFVWATARDWARFGQLYLDDGVVAGRRVLPAGWANEAATPTAGADLGYGALFWTNRGESPGARERRAEGAPADSYEARGYLGQWVAIVPSARLVVVRLGADRGGDQGVPQLVGELVEALGPH